nr:DUF4407 domain-containing protein [Agromyces seonyuensis]
MESLLLRLGGARRDVISDAPGDRPRFIALALVLLSTAVLSGASAVFALVMAVQLPLLVSIVVGIVWGIVILNLDRMLVVGMPRQDSKWANILLALPRLALALVIGVVISTPLVLQIFAREIAVETSAMVQEEKAAFEEELAADPRYAGIPDLEAKIAAEEAAVAAGGAIDLSQDPNYVAAQAATAAAQAAYDEANRVWLAELDGTEGTGIVGDGPITQSKKLDRDGKLAALETAKQAEADAKASAEASLGATASANAAAAAASLPTDQAELARLTEARAAEEAAFESAADGSTGLLARLEALVRIGDVNALLWWAHLSIALLFICIELMPVLMKTLMNLMKPTAYDRLSRVADDSAVAAGRIWSHARLQALHEEAAPELELARDRAARRLAAGIRLNEAFVDSQERAMRAAIAAREDEARSAALATARSWERPLGSTIASGAVADPPVDDDDPPPPRSGEIGLAPLR